MGKLAADDQVLASLQPEAALCLLFFQPGLLHEGEDVKEGSKHILRTDVMFRRDPGTGPTRTPQSRKHGTCCRRPRPRRPRLSATRHVGSTAGLSGWIRSWKGCARRWNVWPPAATPKRRQWKGNHKLVVASHTTKMLELR